MAQTLVHHEVAAAPVRENAAPPNPRGNRRIMHRAHCQPGMSALGVKKLQWPGW